MAIVVTAKLVVIPVDSFRYMLVLEECAQYCV